MEITPPSGLRDVTPQTFHPETPNLAARRTLSQNTKEMVTTSLHGARVLNAYNLRQLKLSVARNLHTQESLNATSSLFDQFDAIRSMLQSLQ